MNLSLKTLLLVLPFYSCVMLGANSYAPDPKLPPSSGSYSSDNLTDLQITKGPGLLPPTEDNPLICHEGIECYHKIIRLTKEWQVYHDDQVVHVPPAGEFRMNMTSGVTLVRILDQNVKANSTNAISLYTNDQDNKHTTALDSSENTQISDAGKDTAVHYGDNETKKSEADQHLPPGAPLEPPPELRNIKPPKTAVHDRASFDAAITVLTDGTSTISSVLSALAELEFMVHEIFWGAELAVSSVIRRLLDLATLPSPSANVRASAALVLGSACSNNPKALTKTIEAAGGATKLITPLVKAVKLEKSVNVRQRLVFALMGMLKEDKVRNAMVNVGGLEILTDVIRERKQSGRLIGRIAVLIEDTFLNKDMRTEDDAIGIDSVEETKLRVMCPVFANAILGLDEEPDAAYKVASTLAALKKKFSTRCMHSDEFAMWLDHVEQDEDDELKSLIVSNRSLLKLREEL